MTDQAVSFVTPYWSGREMMTIHLASIRQFCPTAPILVSKMGGDLEEMEAYREDFGIRYWLEECSHYDALLRLLKRCETTFVCVLDHDAVLLSSLDRYLTALTERRYDLVGVEERIREPPGIDWRRFAPTFEGWLRLAPGNVACNIILFNLQDFVVRWGLRGVLGKRHGRSKDHELDYGVGQRLKRHKYLLPYHTARYGLGNLLMDGDVPVVWHQWYGSHQQRLSATELGEMCSGIDERIALVERGERAFLEDYPRLDLSTLTPAWGPDRDVVTDGEAIAQRYPGLFERSVQRARGWWGYGLRGMAARASKRLERWRWLR